MSLLVGQEDLIPITLFYSSLKNKYGCTVVRVLDEKKAKEMLALPDASGKVKILNTKWRPQTWKDQNLLFKNSTVYNPSTGSRDVDWSIFRHQQLVQCLVDWDIADDANRPVPVTEDNINMLHASIANALSNKYAEVISLDEEEVKN